MVNALAGGKILDHPKILELSWKNVYKQLLMMKEESEFNKDYHDAVMANLPKPRK